MKNTDGQADEEIYRVRSGNVLSTGASVPMKLVCGLQSGNSVNPILLGLLMVVSSHMLDQSLTPFSGGLEVGLRVPNS